MRIFNKILVRNLKILSVVVGEDGVLLTSKYLVFMVTIILDPNINIIEDKHSYKQANVYTF